MEKFACDEHVIEKFKEAAHSPDIACLQGSLSVTAAASGCENRHPSLIVKEKEVDAPEVFLVCEKRIITQVNGLDAPIAVLAAFNTVESFFYLFLFYSSIRNFQVK